jgi:tRNA uridine 5-carboxymethylaminomethyl modification enzyme
MSLFAECRTALNGKSLNGVPIAQLLKRPDFNHADLPEDLCGLAPDDIWESVEADIKYAGYSARQEQQNKEMSKRQAQPIFDGVDFGNVPGLSSETRQKLSRVRPTTLGQAARISGVTPTDISILSIWLIKNNLSMSVRETQTASTD